MKWVKSDAEIKRYIETMPKEIRERMTEERLRKLFHSSDKNDIYPDEYATYRDAKKFHRWGYEVELPSSYDPNEIPPEDTRHTPLHNFEIYAGGWIDFWDTEVRQNSTDHALIFKRRNCDGKWYMDAYILQLKKFDKSNVYLNVANPNPPTSTDPPPPPPGHW
jgi:hypothetical protein